MSTTYTDWTDIEVIVTHNADSLHGRVDVFVCNVPDARLTNDVSEWTEANAVEDEIYGMGSSLLHDWDVDPKILPKEEGYYLTKVRLRFEVFQDYYSGGYEGDVFLELRPLCKWEVLSHLDEDQAGLLSEALDRDVEATA